MNRFTKIIITLGPKTNSPEVLTQILEAGADAIRINLAHGTRESQTEMVRLARETTKKVGRPVAVFGDISGPKFRVGEIEGKTIDLVLGAEVILIRQPRSSSPREIPVRDARFFESLNPNDPILLADGMIALKVMEVEPDKVICQVTVGGVLSSGKGINLPGSALQIDPLEGRGREDLEFGVKAGLDYFALSFVRGPDDVNEAKRLLREMKADIPVIAKIERPEAVGRIRWILNSADGLMVARGDLGVEIPLEEVPIVQKSLISQSRQAGKPVITATQMLRSMMENPRPTRAEVSDVANAIIDGTDAVMLSDETTVGNYPVEAVKMMARIAESIEKSLQGRSGGGKELFSWALARPGFVPGEGGWEDSALSAENSIPESVSHAAAVMAQDLGARLFVVPTRSGRTPRLISRFRTFMPILALSRNEQTIRQLAISFGVVPVLVNEANLTGNIVEIARRVVLELGLARPGSRIVITAGDPDHPGSTEMIKAAVI